MSFITKCLLRRPGSLCCHETFIDEWNAGFDSNLNKQSTITTYVIYFRMSRVAPRKHDVSGFDMPFVHLGKRNWQATDDASIRK